MMVPKKKGGVKGIVLEIIFSLLVLSIFLFILSNYTGEKEERITENPRFVKIDFEQLQKEANAIKIENSSSNKTAKDIFVLTYHVITPGIPKDQFEISYDQFKENMFALKRLGYQTVSLDELYLFMRGEKELPDKSFIITFDDGAKASFYNSDPILEVLNYTAVMFVITGHSLGEKQSAYYLSEKELFDLERTGRWELGSHTHKSHFRLPINAQGSVAPILTNKQWIFEENRSETDKEFYDRVSDDLQRSKSLLEDTFNLPMTSFALPYGDLGLRGSNYADAYDIVSGLTAEIYDLVFYELELKGRYFSGNYPNLNKDSYLIGRLPVDSLRTPEQLLKRIQASRTLGLPYYEGFSNDDRWVRLSGAAHFEEDSILLEPRGNSSYGVVFAYLDGSYLWENYEYSIQLKNTSARKVSLLSRLNREGDYVACKYEEGFVEIVRVEKNFTERISGTVAQTNFSVGKIFTISTYESQVTCLIDGYEVLRAEIPKVSSSGGVGIRVEDFSGEKEFFEFGELSIREISYSLIDKK